MIGITNPSLRWDEIRRKCLPAARRAKSLRCVAGTQFVIVRVDIPADVLNTAEA